MKNYYDVLSIANNASREEIKKAFREKALFWHPDKNSSLNAKDIFILIYEAYDILSNPDKRKAYDRLLFNTPVTSKEERVNYERWAQKSQNKGSKYAGENFSKFAKKVGVGVKKTVNFGCSVYTFIIGAAFAIGCVSGLISIISDIINGKINTLGGWVIAIIFGVVEIGIIAIFAVASILSVIQWGQEQDN